MAPAAQAALDPARVNLIAAKQDKDWRHALTGTVFPPRIGDFSRQDIADYGTQQLDVLASYDQPQSKTMASLYVYRAGLPDVSIWHDRILRVMGMGRLGTADLAKAQTANFTPAGQGEGSGIRSVVALTGKAYTASGVALFRHDDWLIVVRMSSETAAPADLDRMLAGFVDGLRLSPAKSPATAAYGIVPCVQAFPSQPAGRVARDMSSGLLASALLQAIDSGEAKPDKTEPQPALPHYCSDPAGKVDFGAYRDEQSPASYLVAVGDAGNVVWIAPDSMAAILDAKKSGQYSMTLSTVARRIIYTPFTAMPGLAQVMEALGSERPVSMTERPVGTSKNRKITLSPD